MFLKPFLETGDVKFCLWNREAERLAEMLPTLAETVGRRKEWRAVIVCDEAGIHTQNPFDLVKNLPSRFEGPIRGSVERTSATTEEGEPSTQGAYGACSEEYERFLQQEHEKKLRAYDEAAKNPLTRLVTFFCNAPTVTVQKNSPLTNGDVDYARYIAEVEHKQQLRKEILADELTETAQPTEVICVAKRTYVSAEREFNTVWSSHTELEYSHFCDRNMYFDRMRYLVFDILPKAQKDYTFDYIRFLYATIVLASNDIPAGCLASERVYRLECENDEQALSKLLQTYEAKLELTKQKLEQDILQITEKKPLTLSDSEAQQLFCARVEKPVVSDDSFSQTDLYVSSKKVGLANGCKYDEAILWDGEYRRSQKTLAKMLKLSRRALKQVALNARTQQAISFDQVMALSEFQVEDIQEFVDAQELEMLRTNTVDLYDEKAFYESMEEAGEEVLEKIESRMYRNTTLAVGGAACLLFILGFFTLFISGAATAEANMRSALLLTGASLGIFALVTLVTLFFLRRSLVSRFSDFNDVMQEIGNSIHSAMSTYSKYLGHMCNIRQGYAALNAFAKKEDPDLGKVLLYKKHIADIEEAKAATRETFGQFMVNGSFVPSGALCAYDFDFDRPEDYKYCLPYTEGTARKIAFIQTGVNAEVPVEFVKEIKVRREELYD